MYVLLCPQEHFNQVGLVHGDSPGAGGSLFCGRGGHSSLLPVRAPDSSCPKEASASENSPGGLPVPVGCPVLFVWPWSLVLSCCVFRPGGLLIPPNFPREFFLGGKRVPAVGAGPRGPYIIISIIIDID